MKKIIILISLFFGLFLNLVYAESETMFEVEKKEISLDEDLNIALSLETDGNEIQLKDFDLKNNFEIISQNQSSSSYTRINIVNGKQKEISSRKITIYFKLKPLKTGDLSIGPLTFVVDGQEIKTEEKKIKVIEKKVKKDEKNNQSPIIEDVSKEKEKNDYSLYTIYLIIILFLIIFYFILNKILRKITGKNENKFEKYDDFSEKKFIENKIGNNELKNNNKLINKDFYTDFLYNLSEKYNIKDIETKTITEIKNFIPNNNKDIIEILELINLYKYGNKVELKEKIIQLINNFKNNIQNKFVKK